jgi:hypothetical protein
MRGPGLNACKHLMDRQSNCSTGKINPCENVFLENDVYERETSHRISLSKHKKHNCNVFVLSMQCNCLCKTIKILFFKVHKKHCNCFLKHLIVVSNIKKCLLFKYSIGYTRMRYVGHFFGLNQNLIGGDINRKICIIFFYFCQYFDLRKFQR